MNKELILEVNEKFEWHIHIDHIEAFPTMRRPRRPNGVYVHPKTFLPYRLIYGTFAELIDKKYNGVA